MTKPKRTQKQKAKPSAPKPDPIKQAAREIWEATHFYLQEHEIEELRAHLADQLALIDAP
jgi:hypothetical protein